MEVRIYNPQTPNNARKKKPWTYDQAASRKDQAERFVRDVLEDDERADEIAAMSVEDYVAERGKELNPELGGTVKKKASAEEVRGNPVAALIDKNEILHQRIRKLELENKQLEDKLGEIEEIVTCEDPDCEAEDHLAEIEDLVVEKKGHGEEED